LPEAIYIAAPSASISSNLVLSGDTFYWAQIEPGEPRQLFSMAVTGGPVTPVTPEGEVLQIVSKLVIDSGNLYAYQEDFEEPSRLYRVPLPYGAPELIVTEPAEYAIRDFAVHAGVLYYTVGADVKSVPADATNAIGTVVASAAGSEDRLNGIAVDGPLLFWSVRGSPESKIEGDLISGGDRRTLGATQGSYYGQDSLTTDGARVYWADGATLRRNVYDASTAHETIATARAPEITAFAVNATTAYYASIDPTNSINPGDRLEKATFGEKPQAIARQQGVIRSVVVGESGVYWTKSNRIMRAGL
jgi:hypothetical protein